MKDQDLGITGKLHPGGKFAPRTFKRLDGEDYTFGAPGMQGLGLYISEPRSAQETDYRFPEPALLIVNDAGILQMVDVSNAPFLRPELDTLVGGLGFVIEKKYPIRGTHR